MGGSGGTIIVGDKDLVDQLLDHRDKVPSVYVDRMLKIIAEYKQNENSLSMSEQGYLLFCGLCINYHP